MTSRHSARLRRLLLGATGVFATAALVACGSNGDDTDTTDSTTPEAGTESSLDITVGATPVPHGEILEFISNELAEDAGLSITIQEFDDYQLPNRALDEGSLDANYYQHLPFLEQQMEDRGYEFEHGDPVHLEPFAAFSEQHDSVEDIEEGATIGITNDPSNQPRALKLLEHGGLLKDIEDDSSALTLTDEQNPLDLRFEENQPEILAQVVTDPSIDLAIINGNYFIEAGMLVADALIVEEAGDNPYDNFLVWRAGESTEAIEKLDELLHSDEVRDFIEETWPGGEVLPSF